MNDRVSDLLLFPDFEGKKRRLGVRGTLGIQEWWGYLPHTPGVLPWRAVEGTPEA